MRIAIIGAGSIGLLVAASFATSRHHVQLVTRRRDQANKVMEAGLILERANGECERNEIESLPLADMKSEQYDSLIVAVKSYHIAQVMEELTARDIRPNQSCFCKTEWRMLVCYRLSPFRK